MQSLPPLQAWQPLNKRWAALAATTAAAVVAAATWVPAPAHAQGLSFHIGAVSLYKYNGIDQDFRQEAERESVRPALQGGVDYAFGNGFYVGNWNATGRFGASGRAKVEINLYAGHAGALTDALSYDVGVVRFIYPDEPGFNANEIYGRLTFGVVTAQYTRTLVAGGRDLERLGLSVAQPLTDRLTLEGVLGVRNRANAGGAYDYRLGVAYDLGNDLSASAMWTGAQTRKAGAAGEARLILGLSQSF